MASDRATPVTEAVGYFDRAAPDYAGLTERHPAYVERWELFRRLIAAAGSAKPDGGSLAVDLGCGTGVLARHLADVGYRTVGFDGSAPMLERANESLSAEAAGRLELRLAPLPLPEEAAAELAGSADLVVCSSVIEFVADDGLLLAQCARLLAPRGTLLISFPNRESLWRRVEPRMRRLPRLRRSALGVQKHRYTLDEAAAALGRAGLRVRESHYFALPAQALVGALVRSRSRRLAMMFVVVAGRDA